MSSDPKGDRYPWTPCPYADEVAGPLLSHTGETLDFTALVGKSVALYFSAHWCGPCRGFTPKLIETFPKVWQPASPLR